MNKTLVSTLLVILMSSSVFAGDFDKDSNKYLSPSVRSHASVYGGAGDDSSPRTYTPAAPQNSNYNRGYAAGQEDSYSKSYSNGSTSTRYQINNNGLIIHKD